MKVESCLKAVLIDLDGTLVDSLPMIYKIYLKFLKAYGFEGSKEKFAALNGPRLQEVMLILKEEYGISDPVDSLVDKYSTETLKVYESVSMFPGAREFLEFAQRNGLKLALVTAAPRLAVNVFLDKHGLENIFSVIVTGDEVERAKPDPLIYIKALELLHLSSEDVLTIEDSPNGAQASVEAFIPTVFMTHGNSELELEGAKVIPVKNWKAMLSFLEERLLHD
ncbi:MAG: beta-phosphoglucomutase [Chlamydiales bacterium]|jgi:beta-phosphoglucomutase